MRASLFIALLAVCGFALAQTQITVPGLKDPVLVDVVTMTVEIPLQCQKNERDCAPADSDCDGVIDDGCPGLSYNACVAGDYVTAYIDASETGYCNEPKEVPPCAPGLNFSGGQCQ